jgi:hypothetical protein
MTGLKEAERESIAAKEAKTIHHRGTEAQRRSGIVDPSRMPFSAGGWMEK